MKNDTKMIELSVFKKDKRKVFVNFTKNIVEWKNKKYKLKLINVGGKTYPYVILKNIKPLSKIKNEINSINREKNKKELKFVEYSVNGDSFFVTGIGFHSIKASRNGNPEKHYAYNTTLGQSLLRELVSHLDGCVLC